MYGVQTIKRNESLEELLFRQQHKSACGISAVRVALYRQAGVYYSEDEMIDLLDDAFITALENRQNNTRAEVLESFKRKMIKNHPQLDFFEKGIIRNMGMDAYNFSLLAEISGLKAFSTKKGKPDYLEYLLGSDVTPIIHRPSEGDGEGHYLAVTGCDNGFVQLFDPAMDYNNLLWEPREEFNAKWFYPPFRERLLVFFHDSSLRIPFEGREMPYIISPRK